MSGNKGQIMSHWCLCYFIPQIPWHTGCCPSSWQTSRLEDSFPAIQLPCTCLPLELNQSGRPAICLEPRYKRRNPGSVLARSSDCCTNTRQSLSGRKADRRNSQGFSLTSVGSAFCPRQCTASVSVHCQCCAMDCCRCLRKENG